MTRLGIIKRVRRACFSLSFSGRFLILNRIMRNLFVNAKGRITIHDFDGSMTIELNLAEHMQSRIFWVGYYSKSIVNYFNSYLQPGMTVIDVGANIGETTLTAAKRVTSTGKVIAFEPVTKIYSILNDNLKRNRLHWVKPVKLGLSENAGSAPIYTSSDQDINSLENIGLGTLYPVEERQTLIETISLSSLDDYLRENPIDRLDLIKIDIEGAEIPCLFGAQKTIRKFRPQIILETQEETYMAAGYNPNSLMELFTQLDYEIFRLGNNGELHSVSAKSLKNYQNILARPIKERNWQLPN